MVVVVVVWEGGGTTTLVAMVGPMARRRPLPKALSVNISLTGTAKPTEAAKKKRTWPGGGRGVHHYEGRGYTTKK